MEFFAKPGGIYNEKNERIRLKASNFFGMETDIYTVHGLWAVSLDSIIAFMKNNKFNAVRLPISLDFAMNMDTKLCSGINTDINKDLVNITAGRLLETVIQRCMKNGMLVMLDMHTSKASGPIEEVIPNESDWIEGWRRLVRKTMKYPNVFACDLKNEPHGAAKWMDWAKQAERIAAEIHKLNKKLLIFVEGIENATEPRFGSFWGGNFSDVNKYQVKLTVPDKLVYSPHCYGADVFMQNYFKTDSFPQNMPEIWEQQFGFIKSKGIGTVVVGEWGGRMNPGSLDEVWQNAFGNWLISQDIDSFYWCVNPNSGDTKGLLEDDWKTPVANKLALLDKVHKNPTKFNFQSITPQVQQTPVNPQVQQTPAKPQQPTTPQVQQTPTQPQMTPPAKPQTSQPQPIPKINKVKLNSKVVNTWNDKSGPVNQIEVTVANTSDHLVKNVYIEMSDTVLIDCWNVSYYKNIFSFPEWLVNNSGLKVGEMFTFGLIARGQFPTFEIVSVNSV